MLNLSLTFLTLEEIVCSKIKSIAVSVFEASPLIRNSHNLFCLHFYFFFFIFSLSCLTKNLPLWGTMKRLLASLGCKDNSEKEKKNQQHAAYNPFFFFFFFTCTKCWINWWISLESSTNVHGLNPCYHMPKASPLFEDSLVICNNENFNL